MMDPAIRKIDFKQSDVGAPNVSAPVSQGFDINNPAIAHLPLDVRLAMAELASLPPLPCEDLQGAHQETQSAPTILQTSLAGAHIVVIDDEEAVVQITAEMLRRRGALVDEIHVTPGLNEFEVASLIIEHFSQAEKTRKTEELQQEPYVPLIVFDFNVQPGDRDMTGVLVYQALRWQCELAGMVAPPLVVQSGIDTNRKLVEAPEIGGSFVMKDGTVEALSRVLGNNLEKHKLKAA